MMAGKVVGFGFEIIPKLDSYFLMTVLDDNLLSCFANAIIHFAKQQSFFAQRKVECMT